MDHHYDDDDNNNKHLGPATKEKKEQKFWSKKYKQQEINLEEIDNNTKAIEPFEWCVRKLEKS